MVSSPSSLRCSSFSSSSSSSLSCFPLLGGARSLVAKAFGVFLCRRRHLFLIACFVRLFSRPVSALFLLRRRERQTFHYLLFQRDASRARVVSSVDDSNVSLSLSLSLSPLMKEIRLWLVTLSLSLDRKSLSEKEDDAILLSTPVLLRNLSSSFFFVFFFFFFFFRRVLSFSLSLWCSEFVRSRWSSPKRAKENPQKREV